MKIDLSTMAGFGLAAAMRGPDITGPDDRERRYAVWDAATRVKMALTGRLRFLAICNSVEANERDWARTGAILNAEPVPNSVPVGLAADVALMLKHDQHGTEHYLQHIKKGAQALSSLLNESLNATTAGGKRDALAGLAGRQAEATRLVDLVAALLTQTQKD